MSTEVIDQATDEDDGWECEPPEIHLAGAIFAITSCIDRASRPDLMTCPRMAAIREAMRASLVPLKRAMEELT